MKPNTHWLNTYSILLLLLVLMLSACQQSEPPISEDHQPVDTPTAELPSTTISSDGEAAAGFDQSRLGIYVPVRLSADIDHLDSNQRQMLVKLIDASKIMDTLYWQQAYGNKNQFLNSIKDADLRQFADINYGPWDRLDGDKPFIAGVDSKPEGARFYPEDMSKAEFDAWDNPDKVGLYSLVRRNESGDLHLHYYHEAYAEPLQRAAKLLNEAAQLATDPDFANYLNLRAFALVTSDYQISDLAWMDMKNNPIELVIGPIETYEDLLYGYRAAFESYVLIKDLQWSERLTRFAQYLPQLQTDLPVDAAYKQETPGSNADLNAYDVIYYAGHSNAGSKTIAINLPNDEQVQLQKGTRRLQLKNAMRAKFDKILVPLSNLLIVPEQRQHITFDAFFSNTMFHEVAHGLGIKNTINGNGTVREALKEHASPFEEGKADILGLYMIQQLRKNGEVTEGELMDNYVTFMAGIFRSIRFGASSAHGRANLVRFNYFRDQGAFSRNSETGEYSINLANFESAIASLSRLLLTIQGDGDYTTAGQLLAEKGNIPTDLQNDLDRLASQSIPVDIVFEQGVDVAGLR